MNTYKILLVEDEKAQLEALTAHLEEERYEVLPVACAEKAVEMMSQHTIDALITDFNLPGESGQSLLEKMLSINPTIPVIMITAFASIDGAVHAMKSGAYDYLTKPVDVEKLLLILKRALEHKTLISENIRLQKTLERQFSLGGLTARSKKMQEALNLAARVAETRATVLLRGESGTGKEVMAKAIHYASPRKGGPFVAFNVAALSPGLIESELFGHEKGAFTGANRLRIGRFEQAHGGTIFIDEIGDIPVELQTRLLRVLQENVVERLGANEPIHVDIRVIAATHKDLELMIKNGSFREDLYYRLNVVTIAVPPLRERKEDIPFLCKEFVNRISRENNKNVQDFSREAFDALMKYRFPGNVRELENIVERAVILSRGAQITVDDLPKAVFAMTAVDEDGEQGDLEKRVESLERKFIAEEIRRSNGNKSQAARNLGLTWRKFTYKLKKYGLE